MLSLSGVFVAPIAFASKAFRLVNADHLAALGTVPPILFATETRPAERVTSGWTKPFRLMDVAWSFAVEYVIQEESQSPCRSIPFDKEPQDSMIRGVRLGVGTDGETNRAVRSGAPPVFVAALHFALPFRDATHLSLFPSFDGLGRAVFSAFLAYLAEVLHPDIDRWVLDEGQIGSHHSGPDPWSVLGSDDKTEST